MDAHGRAGTPADAAAGADGRRDPVEELSALAGDCVHCGFCLPACPTYQLWGEEMDSPRGRIHLMTQVLDGAGLNESTAEHLDRCLGCMACVPACPSGVRYDRLIESARSWVEDARDRPGPPPGPGEGEDEYRRTLRDRATRAAIFAVFPYPRRLRLLTGPLRAAQRTGLDQLVRRSSLPGRLSPELAAALRLAPPPAGRVPRLPRRVAARGAAPRRGGDAHRLRPGRLLPPGQHGHGACPRGRGLRRCHTERTGVLWRAIAALRPPVARRCGWPGARSPRSRPRGWTRSWSTRRAAARR